MKKSLALTLALIMVLCMLPMTALASYTSPTESEYNLRLNAVTFSVTLPNGSTVTDDIGRFRATDSITLGYQWGKDPCGTSYGWVLTINNIPVHAHWADTGNIYRWVKTDKGKTGDQANSRQAYILYYAKGAPAFVEGKKDQPPKVDGNQITFPDGGSSGETGEYLWKFTLNYDANGGTGAPASQFYGTKDKYTKSHTFTLAATTPTRDDYTFLGWAKTQTATQASYQPKGSYYMSQTVSGYNGGSVSETLYAVWKPSTQPETPPQKPTPITTPTVPGLTDVNEVVKVKCKTAPTSHSEGSFGFFWSSCNVGEPTLSGNEWFCTITVKPDEYVMAYNVMHYSGHTLDSDGQEKTLTLKWNDTTKQWENTEEGKLPITFTVKCETVEPTVPDKPRDDEIAGLIQPIKVKCATNSNHPEKEYNLLEGSCDVGEVSGDKENGYTCDITVKPDKYVRAYNDDVTGAKHTLAAGEGDKIVTLKYDAAGNQWTVVTGTPVVFTVKCEDVTTYTVTYKDGVSGTAFKDQVYTGLKLGDATPGFTGTPYRLNYTFTGWKPAVEDKVSGDAVYTAQWIYNGGSWTPSEPITPVPPVIVPPKTGDMTIWQSILHFLGIR